MSDLPDDVRRFIVANIASVAQIEVLLLLRVDRSREWSLEELSRALYTATGGMAEPLNDLVDKGLVEVVNETFRYRPQVGGELDAVVEHLAKVYKERQVTVISVIYAEPVDKARSFADAFRIIKEEEEP